MEAGRAATHEKQQPQLEHTHFACPPSKISSPLHFHPTAIDTTPSLKLKWPSCGDADADADADDDDDEEVDFFSGIRC